LFYLRQQATALKEMEFILHHGKLITMGTQAAALAGLDGDHVYRAPTVSEGGMGEWDDVVVAHSLTRRVPQSENIQLALSALSK
jgi:hypothetical protein